MADCAVISRPACRMLQQSERRSCTAGLGSLTGSAYTSHVRQQADRGVRTSSISSRMPGPNQFRPGSGRACPRHLRGPKDARACLIAGSESPAHGPASPRFQMGRCRRLGKPSIARNGGAYGCGTQPPVAENISNIIGDLGSDAARGLWRRWRGFVRVDPDACTHADAQSNTDAIPHTDTAAQRGG